MPNTDNNTTVIRLRVRATVPLRKVTARFKGGPGSGFRGHVGRPGEVGGSLAEGFLRIGKAISKGSALDIALDSGELDIPKDVKKRRYSVQAQDVDKLVEAYANKVWDSMTQEMKSQGLSDEDIESIRRTFGQLLSSNDKSGAKPITGAMLVADGKSVAEAKAIMLDETFGRMMPHMPIAYDLVHRLDAGEDMYAENNAVTWFALDTGGRRIYESRQQLVDEIAKYAAEHPGQNYGNYGEYDLRSLDSIINNDPDSPYRGYFTDKVKNYVETIHSIDEDLAKIDNPNFVKGIDIVRETSQRLFERNAESTDLSRGIYEFELRHDSDSKYVYQPVTAIDSVLNPQYYLKWNSPEYTEYEKQDFANRYNHGPVPDIVANAPQAVIIKTDTLTAWAPSEKIARSFSAGGGYKGQSFSGKAILHKSNVTPSQVALYWPAIYAHLWGSIDTKEVWTYNNNGEMLINRTDFEKLK